MIGILAAVGCALATPATPTGADEVSYSRHIQPILARRCYACHGPDEAVREGGLAMHQREGLLAESDSGERAVVPGRPQRSELLRRVMSDDDSERMPPPGHGTPLTPEEVEWIRQWIEQGAPFEVHWAYRPLQRPAVPSLTAGEWSVNAIDAFVWERMSAVGLQPAEPAARETWLRRVSLDLTGLPPTLAEQDAFLQDDAPDAYERVVDRLLASPAYGEHWARLWLDLARYADSQGYAQDELRSIWKYRDWVIAAWNADMPFDQFTIEQLAGDLLPDPTNDQLIATGFHRNTMTNTEGGTDDEEFRHAAVVDRVNTTGTVWLATTLGCAQCHTHKYDPITHEEYYRLFAIFNQTADNDQPDNRPLLELWDEGQQERRAALLAELAAAEELASEQAGNPAAEEAAARAHALRQSLDALQPVTTPIMRELPADQRRETRIALGGAHLRRGERVQPGVPAAWQWSVQEPTNRLELAQWLVAPENPLVPRVVVNRHWEQFFGQGLVQPNDDFGAQGNLPTHPELLDWLAAEWRDGGWSLKALSRQIVLSQTYRQSSRVTPDKLRVDAGNRWLSRAPRFRLSAEALRDYSLAVSGLLSTKRYGPPVRPPQPTSGLRAAFGGSLDWAPSEGEDRYRRGLYTQWRRVYPYPSFMALDATNRTICTARRVATNTPVAALVTLNDPAFVECAQGLAHRAMAAVPDDEAARLVHLFRVVVCRTPQPDEIDSLRRLLATVRDAYREQPDQALLLAGRAAEDGAGIDGPALAAWVVLANTLLNLDEVLTRH